MGENPFQGAVDFSTFINECYESRDRAAIFWRGQNSSESGWGGDGWSALVAQDLEEIPWNDVCKLKVGYSLSEVFGLEQTFIVGVIPYLDEHMIRSHRMELNAQVPKARAFLVKKGWFLGETKVSKSLWQPLGFDSTEKCPFLTGLPQQETHSEGLTFLPQELSKEYLEKVLRVLESIKNGEFYQLNLLRYFEVDGVSPNKLISLFESRSGPMSSWIITPELEVFSLSPERMLKTRSQCNTHFIEVFPIKGTAPRGTSPDEDMREAHNLFSSSKNRAELSMIIDLMRNDLLKICQKGRVQASQISLKSYANVHHLVGHVQGQLIPNLSFGELLYSLLPGGSITGAPKLKVMKSIAQLEERSRGYFMGNAFVIDTNGHIDCSILIRTLIKEENSLKKSCWNFAAGSGIVIHSDPQEELREIDYKASIFTKE